MTPTNASQIDFAPLIIALAGLITSGGGAIVVYVRFVLNKQSLLFDDALNRLDDERKRNETLSKNLSATQQHNARLAENNRSMKDDIQELRDKLDKLQRQFDEIQGQRDNERRKAEQRAMEYQDEIIKRDRTITALREEIAALNKRFDSVNERLNILNTDYAAVVTERDKLRKETEALAALVATLQKENAAVTRHNGELDGKVRKLESDMDMMKAANAPSASEIFHAPDNTLIVLEAKRKKATEEMTKLTPPDDSGDAA